MIQFLVIIAEDEQGRVHLHSQTPAGSCTPGERVVGLEFKAMFDDLCLRHQRTIAEAIVRADPQNLARLTPAAAEIVYQYRLQRYSISPAGKSITCNTCGKTSYHPKDVEQRFCERCKVFHDDPPSMREIGRQIKTNIEQRVEGEKKL